MSDLEYNAEYNVYHKNSKHQKKGYSTCVKNADKNAMLCFLKGVCEFKGYGTKKNIKKCIKTLSLAIEKGSIYAPGLLAYLYDKGIGVEKKPSVAYELYLKGAKLGDFDAMYNLAEVYSEGDLVARDMRKSKYWRKKANRVVGNLYNRIAHRVSQAD